MSASVAIYVGQCNVALRTAKPKTTPTSLSLCVRILLAAEVPCWGGRRCACSLPLPWMCPGVVPRALATRVVGRFTQTTGTLVEWRRRHQLPSRYFPSPLLPLLYAVSPPSSPPPSSTPFPALCATMRAVQGEGRHYQDYHTDSLPVILGWHSYQHGLAGHCNPCCC
jgi:hypothetical protein